MPFEKLVKCYACALCLLLITMVSWFVVEELQLAKQQELLGVVNKAGRQRMLSQQITKNMLMVVGSEELTSKEFYIDEMEKGLIEFTAAHENLLLYNQAHLIVNLNN